MTHTKIRDISTFTVVLLGDREITDDLSECLIVSCGNYTQLSKITGWSLNRCVYLFTKMKKKSWREGSLFVLKSSQYYKGNQIGGIRNPAIYSRGND